MSSRVPRRGVQRRGMPASWLRAEHALVERFVAEEEQAAANERHAVAREESSADAGETCPSSESSLHSPFVSSFAAFGEAACAEAARTEGRAAADERLRRLLLSKGSVRVEVGAGAGDWILAQAAAQPQTAWVAVEPQLDRVHRMWSKLLMHRLSNVHICAAEASAVHSAGVLPAGMVDAVHVRFPYPPDIELHELASTTLPSHGLLDGAFVADVAHVLKPGGTLQLVTNEPASAALMLATIRLHPAGQAFRSLDGPAGFVRSAQPEGSPDADSFFDAVLAHRGRRAVRRAEHERYTLTFERALAS